LNKTIVYFKTKDKLSRTRLIRRGYLQSVLARHSLEVKRKKLGKQEPPRCDLGAKCSIFSRLGKSEEKAKVFPAGLSKILICNYAGRDYIMYKNLFNLGGLILILFWEGTVLW
jgi:hypothetical protein